MKIKYFETSTIERMYEIDLDPDELSEDFDGSETQLDELIEEKVKEIISEGDEDFLQEEVLDVLNTTLEIVDFDDYLKLLNNREDNEEYKEYE